MSFTQSRLCLPQVIKIVYNNYWAINFSECHCEFCSYGLFPRLSPPVFTTSFSSMAKIDFIDLLGGLGLGPQGSQNFITLAMP